jgi:signal transduction histidine kinase
VADDGTGFDPKVVHGGEGLRSLARRAAEMGASLSIESRRGGGTVATLEADMTRTRDGAAEATGV